MKDLKSTFSLETGVIIKERTRGLQNIKKPIQVWLRSLKTNRGTSVTPFSDPWGKEEKGPRLNFDAVYSKKTPGWGRLPFFSG